jgi:hypothetical protein
LKQAFLQRKKKTSSTSVAANPNDEEFKDISTSLIVKEEIVPSNFRKVRRKGSVMLNSDTEGRFIQNVQVLLLSSI